jgi:predicted helicase
MNRAIEFAKDIERKKHVLKTATSYKLINDYSKSVKRSIRELKYYCRTRGLNFQEVMREAKRCLAG